MNLKKEQIILLDKYVQASVLNLRSFTERNKRNNYYIPHSFNQYEVLYNIEIAKTTSLLDGYRIKTLTYKVENFEDLKFLLTQKWKMRKNNCTIKRAKKTDINNDIQNYTDFMNQEFREDMIKEGIGNIYKKIYTEFYSENERS